MVDKAIVLHDILIPSICVLYKEDFSNIRFDVSERNICARLAHHMENIMREYDAENGTSFFTFYYADVEYNRMGNGDMKYYEDSLKRPKYMVSDLLIQSRGYEGNLLAVELKKKGATKEAIDNDIKRLKSLVTPGSLSQLTGCYTIHCLVLSLSTQRMVSIWIFSNSHQMKAKLSLVNTLYDVYSAIMMKQW